MNGTQEKAATTIHINDNDLSDFLLLMHSSSDAIQ